MTVRVLYVIPGATFGGAHNQVLRLAPVLGDEGFKPIVILPDEDGDAFERLTTAGIETYREPLVRVRATTSLKVQARFSKRFPTQARRIADLVVRHGASVVQAHGVTQLDVALGAAKAESGLIWQLLDTRSPQFVNAAIAPALSRLPDVIMCTGRGTLEHHIDPARLSMPVVEYAPPVSDGMKPLTMTERALARSVLGLSENQVMVASLGNLNPQKAHVDLLTAMAGEDGVRVLIRGGRSAEHVSYEEWLHARAYALGYPQDVIGQLDSGQSVQEFLGAADVFCLASAPRSEGLPTVVLEAMACGLPIVASRVGSTDRAVKHGDNGYLFTSGDVKAMNVAITKLKENVDLRITMGRSSSDLFRKEFNFRKCAEANLRALRLAMHR